MWAGSVGCAQFDEEYTADDKDDSDAHKPGERIPEQELRDDRGQGDPCCGPDTVSDADRHSLSEYESQQAEGHQVRDRDGRVPAPVVDREAKTESA